MVHSTWLLIVLLILAVARGTRLINDDVILDGPRLWLLNRKPDGRLAALVLCPWCVSIWVGFTGAALLYWLHSTWPIQVGLLALAASQVTGMLALLVGVMEKGAN